MTRSASYFGLWFDGFARGIKIVVRSRNLATLRFGLRTILCPVDLWRYIEFSQLLGAYSGETEALDAGSPKLAVPLLQSTGCRCIHATDISGNPLVEFGAALDNGWREHVARVQASACCLPYPSKSFPFVFSVSAIEHIGADGDSVAVAELARVLADGGRLFISVPFVAQYHEQWVERDPYGKQVHDEVGRVFFSRYYDWETLQSRIVIPSGLRLVSFRVWQEARAGWYADYGRRTANGMSPSSIITKLFDAFWALHRLEEVTDEPERIQRHGVAILILEK